MASKPEVQQATGLALDKLSRKQLKEFYEITNKQLDIDPELRKLFKDAWEQKWDKTQWDIKFKQSDWYRNNARPIREYLLASADPDNADFIAKTADSVEAVKRRAMDLGVNLSSQRIEELARENLMFGWGDQGQEFKLERAILDSPADGEFGGDIRANAENLKTLAIANGVKYDDAWFDSAAKSIAGSFTTADFWQNKIRDEAASLYPVFRDQITAGQNMRAVASPYLKMMQDMWEVDANTISLDDPTLLNALTSFDEKGNARAMNLGDFRRKLRQDPRFMDTTTAQNEVADIATGVLRMFGIGG